MSILSGVRRTRYLMSEALGVSGYLHAHKYAFRMESKVYNPTPASVNAFVALPIPPQTATQHLSDEPMIEPKPDAIGTDGQYGNRYAAWTTELRARSVSAFTMRAIVSVSPFAPSLRPSTFGAYAKMSRARTLPFLGSTPNTDATDERVMTLAQRIAGRETDPVRIAKRLNAHVVSSLRYGDPINGLYRASDALERSRVDCGGFASFFVAMAKSVGIPARIAAGFFADQRGNAMHAWAEWLHPSGAWVPVDPASERLARDGRTKKSGRFGFVGSDRILFSVGDHIPISHAGFEVFIEILQHPFVFVEKEGGGGSEIFAESKLIIPKLWRV